MEKAYYKKVKQKNFKVNNNKTTFSNKQTKQKNRRMRQLHYMFNSTHYKLRRYTNYKFSNSTPMFTAQDHVDNTDTLEANQ